MKTGTIILNGGIGNQLFQYCMGLYIKKKLKINKIYIDSFLFFKLKNPYGRKFILKHLGIVCQNVPYRQRLLNYLRLSSFWKYLQAFALFSTYINLFDRDNAFVKPIIQKNFNNILLFGYFQNFKVVQSVRNVILKSIKLPVPKNQKILDLALRLMNTDSVAIGIRSYEETVNPQMYSSTHEEACPQHYTAELSRIIKYLKTPLVLLFSTKNTEFLTRIKVPCEHINIPEIFPEISELDALWLLTRCQHHIFNNSTFYWWGAFLSDQNYKGFKKRRFISIKNNFINRNVYPPSWKKF